MLKPHLAEAENCSYHHYLIYRHSDHPYGREERLEMAKISVLASRFGCYPVLSNVQRLWYDPRLQSARVGRIKH